MRFMGIFFFIYLFGYQDIIQGSELQEATTEYEEGDYDTLCRYLNH